MPETSKTPSSGKASVAVFQKKFGEESRSVTKWNGRKSLNVVTATIAAIEKPDGTTVELTADQKTSIAAIFSPTVVSQIAVVKKVIADAGGNLDTDTEALIKKLLNPNGVTKQLENARKPGRLNLSSMVVVE